MLLSWPGLDLKDPACQDHIYIPWAANKAGLRQAGPQVLQGPFLPLRFPVNPKTPAKSFCTSSSITAMLGFSEVDITSLIREEVRPGGGQSRGNAGSAHDVVSVEPRASGAGRSRPGTVMSTHDVASLGAGADTAVLKGEMFSYGLCSSSSSSSFF